ncbi:hypothetical protein HHI36_013752 [Cryptolaemus montrouzieri]|uniref:Threonine aspartase 1 n=1 Tax=Cryptolaemus montrouzieri TaxID=559131 RepID=A0ABD2NI74_9CUCU
MFYNVIHPSIVLGGILLKQSGRVGQSALYACGTWADSLNKEDEPSVAVCTSGCGEHLVQTQLAKEIANDLKKNECPTTGLHKSIMDNFINSRYLRNVEQKLCGALALHRSGSEISLLWGHSTETMSVGYMKTDDKKPVDDWSSILPPVHSGLINEDRKFY